MLKLIKYDFRRKRDRILAMFVIMLLAHIGIWISSAGLSVNTIVLHLMVYLFLALGIILNAARTFGSNLTAYHRRLLPEKTLSKVLAPLVLCWVLLLAAVFIAFLHLQLYEWIFTLDFLPVNFWPVAPAILALYGLWTAGYLLIILMFVISTVHLLRVKGKVWIGIFLFVVLQNGFYYVESLIFGTISLQFDQMFNFEVMGSAQQNSVGVVSYGTPSLWPVIFEMVLAVLMLGVTHYLVQNKVED